MGLACSLYRASASEVERLIADPDTLDDFIESVEGPSLPVREVRPKGILGFLLRLTPITITEVVPEEERGPAPDFTPDPDRSTDIDKLWHGLHFLLTGTADGGDEPACYFDHGGEEIDDEGLARVLRPDQVRRFSDHLAALTPEDLRRRYDPARMVALRIYPEGLWMQEARRGESPLDGLINAFVDVQSFVKKAAAAGDGVILRIA